MKAKFFFILLFTFCLSASTYADSRETIKFSNVEQTENGCIKEFLCCDKATNAPISKTVYRYDNNDKLLEKATYEWNSLKGWVGTQKYVYTYENDKMTPSVIKWNNKSNDWAD